MPSNFLKFTARTKITLVFVGLVSVLLFVTSYILFSIAEDTWHSKKMELMQTAMENMTMESNVWDHFINYRVIDADGATKKQGGIFDELANEPKDGIMEYNGKYYIIYTDWLDKWPRILIAEDVTDVVGTKYEQAKVFIWTSWITLGLVILLWFSFTYIAFRPVRELQKISESFTGAEIPRMDHVLSGNTKDEFIQLAASMEQLFHRIRNNTETLENFSDHIAHEIKNRLFEIQTTLETWKKRNPENAITESLELIKSLNQMTNSLLLLHTGMWTLNRKDMSISELVEHAFGESRTRLVFSGKKNIKWNVDPTLFGIALFNIIQNSLKYSEGQVEIVLAKNNLEIKDSGTGISAETLPFIFDRLFKGDKSRTYNTGYGLGLAISRKIVEAHGYIITAESTLGVGTTIVISYRR